VPSSDARSAFDALDNQAIRLKQRHFKLSIDDAPRSIEMADLIAQIPLDGRMCHVRDAEYLNWRYCNPRSAYRFLFWGERELQGY